jgi:hypothetical protein
MTDATRQKFMVLYLIPAAVMADWAKKPTPRYGSPQNRKCKRPGENG